jgi:hypothetical protein
VVRRLDMDKTQGIDSKGVTDDVICVQLYVSVHWCHKNFSQGGSIPEDAGKQPGSFPGTSDP